MTDPFLSPVWAPGRIPGQAAPPDHPMLPDVVRPAAGATQPPAPTPAREPYASWHLRVAAALIDSLLQVPFLVAQVIGLIVAFDGGGLSWVHRDGWGTWNDTIGVTFAQMSTSTWIGLAVANAASVAGGVFSFCNSILRQGRRGSSIGKQCLHLIVVSHTDGRPIGAALTVVRNLAHVFDVVTLGIGYLWPLWDRKRQTFADAVMGTVVLHLPPTRRTSPRIPEQAPAPYGS